ncbi:MAG: type II toxin-antitoxin system VapC family toxin [Deltaproteobacteria bacterium]|nr:type II toxin-antitoxin system VapC family toxin [Deltaproteobacteria bacterium]
MAEVVLDANLIVALLYEGDVHHRRAKELADRLEADGHILVLLDVLVYEAVPVLCRRAREKKTSPPNLVRVLAAVRGWFDEGLVRFVADEASRLVADVLDVIQDTAGALNFNDALLVVLESEGIIDKLASFDPGFDAVAGFPRIA